MRTFLIRHINTLWLMLVVACAGLLLLYPEAISKNSIADFLANLGASALFIYLLLSLARSLLMIPCTPFVLAGGISFPEIPAVVMVISYAGIVTGAFLVYSFPSFGHYDAYLEGKYPNKLLFLREKLHGRHAFWIVAGWSFFPFVPTDLICYVAGVVKMSFRKMASAVVIGEIPLVTLYVYVGIEIGDLLRT
ncbi:MAG: VTT domain-containing protein [Gammaproteobacteria bacterium]|nr:VTT domain-containing protein [Gammaproteobacteria bacterium]